MTQPHLNGHSTYIVQQSIPPPLSYPTAPPMFPAVAPAPASFVQVMPNSSLSNTEPYVIHQTGNGLANGQGHVPLVATRFISAPQVGPAVIRPQVQFLQDPPVIPNGQPSYHHNLVQNHSTRPPNQSPDVAFEDFSLPKKKKKQVKDPDAPKHPMSPFLYFLAQVRPKYTARYPGSKVGPISKMISKEWREMTPDQRKVYEKKAGEDKARYAREMEVYLAKKHLSNRPIIK